MVSLAGSCVSYFWAAEAAQDAGAAAEDIVGTLIAVAPISGLACVIAAAPQGRPGDRLRHRSGIRAVGQRPARVTQAG
jgi:hypothetical protein